MLRARSDTLFPVLVAILLSLPCLGFTFLWDDYLFLNNALSENLRDWLPQADDPFYRPISRALYFGIVSPFGTSGALLAHVLNLVYLACAVLLLTLLAVRLRGKSYGLTTGILFASMAAVPTLVGWASCSQDLLSIVFVLLALLARWHGRNWLALGAFGAALLSKETALAMAPALAGFDAIIGRRAHRLKHHGIVYACAVLAWAAIHPAARILVTRGLAPGATGYVGLTEPRTWLDFGARYLNVMMNTRIGTFDPTWPPMTGVFLLLVTVTCSWGYWSLAKRARSQDDSVPEAPVPVRRVALLGILMALPPLLMTSTIINGWAPYYAAFPMVGCSLLAALGLERLKPAPRAGVIGLYLLLGIWARGSDLDATHLTERALRPSSDAIKRIEHGFHSVLPELLPNSDVVLSIQAAGIPRVYAQMYAFQPLRLWYRDLSIHVVKPIRYHPSDRPALLAVVTKDFDVVLVDPQTFAARTASGRRPEYVACEKAVRGLAVGMGGSGQARMGASILLRLSGVDSDIGMKSTHQRLAAMLLLASGDGALADSLIATAIPMPRELAIQNLNVILAEQPPGVTFDDAAFRAFGVSASDPDALRDISAWLARYGYGKPARRLATRLLAVRPGDPAGLRTLAIADSTVKAQAKWPEEL